MEIQMDILKAVVDGRVKPTHIMYRANLSWIRLQKLLDTLVSQNLLQEKVNQGNTIYEVTRKGKDVLGYYKQIVGELSLKKKTPIPLYIKSR
jgi:predicted transcriptional regulator